MWAVVGPGLGVFVCAVVLMIWFISVKVGGGVDVNDLDY